MTEERTLHAWGRGWDAADAVAARMRIEAVLKSVQAPIVNADAGMEGQAIMSLGTPSRHPMACRLGADGRTLMAVCAIPSETEGGGRLAFGLSGHPCISGFALDMPLGHVPLTGTDLILDTDSLVARLTLLLDATSTTTDLLLAGRRNEAIARRREAGGTATSSRTVVGGHWMDRGSLDGPLSMVIATVCPSTPWSRASMYTTQAVSPHTMPPVGTMGIQPRTSISLLDEEGLSILDSVMSPCVEIDWSPDVKTPDGHEIRRMHVGPPSFTGMISKSSQPDAMEMLRAHRMVPIPEHCVTRIGS